MPNLPRQLILLSICIGPILMWKSKILLYHRTVRKYKYKTDLPDLKSIAIISHRSLIMPAPLQALETQHQMDKIVGLLTHELSNFRFPDLSLDSKNCWPE